MPEFDSKRGLRVGIVDGCTSLLLLGAKLGLKKIKDASDSLSNNLVINNVVDAAREKLRIALLHIDNALKDKKSALNNIVDNVPTNAPRAQLENALGNSHDFINSQEQKEGYIKNLIKDVMSYLKDGDVSTSSSVGNSLAAEIIAEINDRASEITSGIAFFIVLYVLNKRFPNHSGNKFHPFICILCASIMSAITDSLVNDFPQSGIPLVVITGLVVPFIIGAIIADNGIDSWIVDTVGKMPSRLQDHIPCLRSARVAPADVEQDEYSRVLPNMTSSTTVSGSYAEPGVCSRAASALCSVPGYFMGAVQSCGGLFPSPSMMNICGSGERV